MSDLRLLVLGACLTMGASSTALSAQHGGATIDSARRELQRLDSLYAVRRTELARAESTSAAARPLERVESGSLRIRVAASLADRVREAAALTMPALESRGGDALRQRIARHLPSITIVEDARLLGTEWYVRVTADTGRYRVPSRRFASAGRVGTDAIAEQLALLVEAYAMDDADSVLLGWMMGVSLPLRDRPAGAWSAAYLELMTVESVALRRCRAGNADGCLAALGVLPDDASAFHAWYAPEDYRSLTRLVRYDAKDSATASAMHRCREQGDAEACAALMAKVPRVLIGPPLSPETRHLFVEEVLRAGGEGAYERLMTALGPMPDRLRAAAGVPLEQVADRWRVRVIAARPREAQVSPVLTLATLGWCGLLTLVAFTRRPTCG